MEKNNVELVWGNRILDDGFSTVPKVLIRNYRKLGISHAEFGLINILITFKHDSRDPFPSQETLAKIFFADDYKTGNSERAIRKHIESLKKKKLIRVGIRKDSLTKKYSSNVYSLEPLINKCISILGYETPYQEKQYDVIWEDENPEELKVPTAQEPKVPTAQEPKVPTNITREYKKLIEKEEEEETPYNHIFDLVDKNITSVNEVIKNSIQEWLNKLPYDVVLEEIHNCIKRSAKSWVYVENTLSDDYLNGIDTVEKLNTKIETHKNNRKPKKNYRNAKKPIRQEKLPEWYGKEEDSTVNTDDDPDYDFEIEKAKLEKELKEFRSK